MSNRFKALDTYFPCGKDRIFGEVVSVSISLQRGGVQTTSFNWKRKAGYVNASVNAFHMHRGLCREFSNENSWFPEAQLRKVKRLIGDIVEASYLREFNSSKGRQYYSYVIDIDHLTVWADEEVIYLPEQLFWLHQAAIFKKLPPAPAERESEAIQWLLKPYDWNVPKILR